MHSEILRQRIIERIGTFPTVLVPALPTPEVLEDLWETLRSAYLDTLLPRRLKEKIGLRISLYGTVPSALFWHCCELKESGVASAEILALLENPAETNAALRLLRNYPADVTTFPPELENAIAIATSGVFLRLPEIDQLQQEIRRTLGTDHYNRWVALVACLEMFHRWTDAHPEIGLEVDPITRRRSLIEFKDDPRLIDFLSRWRLQMERNRYLEERLGQVEAEAPKEKALRERFRTISRVTAILVGGVSLGVIGERILSTKMPFLTFFTDLKVSIGMAAILGSGSLWAWNHRPLTPLTRVLARVTALFVCVCAALILLPGPASFMTAVVFFLLGLSLFTMERTFYGKSRWSEWLTIVAGILCFFSLLANAFEINTPIAGSERLLLMSPAAASITMLLTIGILTASPSGQLLAMVGGTTHAGKLVRRAVLLFLLLPVALGWVGALGEWAGWYGADIGVPMIIIGNLVLLGAIALAMGRTALRAEHQQEQIETLLRHRDQDFRGTFDQAAVGMAHIGLDGRYIRVNDRLCEILGCSREDLLGNPVQQMIHPEDQAGLLELIRRLMSGEIPEFNAEKRYLCRHGGVIWVNLSATLLRDNKGKRRYTVMITEEITERKLAEEEAIRQKANAEAASQAKDNLLSVISHELRTPLTPVLAALSSLQPEDEEQRELLAMSRRNIEHEICLVDDLLDLTRLTHGKMRLSVRPLDLHRLIEEVVTSLRSTFDHKGVHLRVLLGATRHVVNGDPSRLRQILMNLLDNARKFTATGGRVSVATSDRDDRILVRITDSGAGISPENLTRIFEAFEQAESSIQRTYGGLGLGLTITKGLVEAHGGTLGVESPGLGRGSSFFFELPVSDAVPDEPPSCKPLPAPFAKRILLVEDHEDTRMTLQHLLQRHGYEVCSVSGVHAALDAARRAPFDVLVSDLGLPDGSGLDLPKIIASTTGQLITSIALSGFGSEEDSQLSLRAGYLLHLTKPIDLNELESAILQVCTAKPVEARK